MIKSAGVEAHGLNPKAVAIMKEDGVDISEHTSNNLNEYLNIDFDYIITVCDNANERCPIFPGSAVRLHRNFPDPTKSIGSEAKIREEFLLTRDLIKEYCRDFVSTYIN